ncbi:hypothetical protein AcV5_003598 [Taiwanofungus camphoratus]|nr:hypothetical protein AcV5_003598 [Antrodia cinnamomea]
MPRQDGHGSASKNPAKSSPISSTIFSFTVLQYPTSAQPSTLPMPGCTDAGESYGFQFLPASPSSPASAFAASSTMPDREYGKKAYVNPSRDHGQLLVREACARVEHRL